MKTYTLGYILSAISKLTRVLSVW